MFTPLRPHIYDTNTSRTSFTQALVSDYEAAFRSDRTTQSAHHQWTLYHLDYAVYVHDEIHHARNSGFRNSAAIALANKSHAVLGLSATPVITRVTVRLVHDTKHIRANNVASQDLVYIGRILKIDGCREADLRALHRQLNSARAADRSALRGTAHKVDQLSRQVYGGPGRLANPSGNHDLAAMLILGDVHTWYKGRAYRRTISSTDNLGNPIWGGIPPREQMITLIVNATERAVLDQEAEEFINDRTVGWQPVGPFGVILLAPF